MLIQMLHTKNVIESGLKFFKKLNIQVDATAQKFKWFLCCSDYGHEMAFLQPLLGKKSPLLSVNNKE